MVHRLCWNWCWMFQCSLSLQGNYLKGSRLLWLDNPKGLGHQANKQFHSPFQLSSDPSNCSWAGLKLVILIIRRELLLVGKWSQQNKLGPKIQYLFWFCASFQSLLPSSFSSPCSFTGLFKLLSVASSPHWLWLTLIGAPHPVLSSSALLHNTVNIAAVIFPPVPLFLSIYRC